MQHNFRDLGRKEITVLNDCVHANLKLHDGKEELDTCKALDDIRREAAEDAAEKAAKAAEENTLLQALRNIMETLHLSAGQVMAVLKIPESKRPGLISIL